MNAAARLALASVLALSLGACSSPKPIAYRASSAEVIDYIAEIAPKLHTKLVNEPYRVTARSAGSISIATHVPTAAKVTGLLMFGTANFGPDARIDFEVKDSAGAAYVTYKANTDSLGSAVNEVLDYLDHHFMRVQF